MLNDVLAFYLNRAPGLLTLDKSWIVAALVIVKKSVALDMLSHAVQFEPRRTSG